MSEEKLYAVKNNEGEYWEFSSKMHSFFDFLTVDMPVTIDKDLASEVARNTGAHVVTLIEEPEKVVLSKEQAEIVEKARDAGYPATYISDHSYADEERLIINAYVNGYTVAKEKKYNVKVPHAVNSYFKKIDANYCIAGDTFYVDLDEDLAQFTESEIEHYGLQDCEKEEVTDDGE